jgi:hypothetical protein
MIPLLIPLFGAEAVLETSPGAISFYAQLAV